MGLICSWVWPAYALTGQTLIEKAKESNLRRYEYAVTNGAVIETTSDGKSFYLLWRPYPSVVTKPSFIVTIHGHGSFAFDEFFLWHRHARERGYGILAIQWWLGEGERFQDYFAPEEIYRVIDEVLKKEGVGAGRHLFHGFSRGSANSYAVAALDRNAGSHYFSLFIANAGRPGLDFPPNNDIENGKYGEYPLEGTRWVTYAGALDKHPNRDGVEGMRQARQWIKKYGGEVLLAIEDPEGDHGGFHRREENIGTALTTFAETLNTS